MKEREVWVQSQNRLLSLQNGSFNNDHWREALKLLRLVPYLQFNREIVEGSFLLMDRLSEEMSPDRHLPIEIVQRVLGSWQRVVVRENPAAQLDPETVKTKIARYTDSRLVHPDEALHLHNVILRVLGDIRDPQKAQDYVRWIETSTQLKAGSMIYRTLMSIGSDRGVPQLVEDAFNALNSGYEKGSEQLRPAAKDHVLRLQSWSKAGNPEMATLSLRDMIFSDDFQPDRRHFHSVLQAWANSKHPQAARKAEECLRLMDKLSAKFDSCSPNEFSFNHVINTLVYSNLPGSIQRAETLLLEMQSRGIKPDVATYNSIMSNYAKSTSPEDFRRVEQLDQERRNRGLERTAITYTSLMSAHARNGGVEEMESLFQEMKGRYMNGDESVKPPYAAHVLRLQSYSKIGDADNATLALSEIIANSNQSGYLDRKPGTQEFTAVIEAWARSGRPEAIDKAEAGLRQMIKLSQQGRYKCHPNVFSFTAVLSAHGKSRAGLSADSGQRALAIFNQLKKLSEKDPKNKLLRPLFVTYSNVCLSLIRSKDETAAKTLQSLLNELRAKDKEFWVASGNVSYPVGSIVHELQMSKIGNKNELIQQFEQLLTATDSLP
eukprot:CAMPEP_0168819218 /NCGR_PEP_ID=MMETSP0726-20121227/8178_1 /TAXON_ID=265536 /ORGANISM="Amphiprora sp., Strain CCMP467" /LENGTH=604 /DNA_ID=CAMNT_0008871607 /DNA_START=227 /DNA_END=2038 /DNA_ORIENTATION=-